MYLLSPRWRITLFANYAYVYISDYVNDHAHSVHTIVHDLTPKVLNKRASVPH